MKKKYSKKKVSYNNKTIVTIVIALLVLFVLAFAYQSSKEVSEDDEEGLGTLGMFGQIAEMFTNMFLPPEEVKTKVPEVDIKMPQKLDNGGCCYYSCVYGGELLSSPEKVANKKHCKEKAKGEEHNCLKKPKEGKEPAMGGSTTFTYIPGYSCVDDANKNTVFAKVSPFMSKENKAKGRPWTLMSYYYLPGENVDGFFPTELAINEERSNDINRELYCTLENAKKSDEGKSALLVQRRRCWEKIDNQFNCRGEIILGKIIYDYPVITTAYYTNTHAAHATRVKPVCGVSWECAQERECE